MAESVQLSFVIMRMSFEYRKDMIFLFSVPFLLFFNLKINQVTNANLKSILSSNINLTILI